MSTSSAQQNRLFEAISQKHKHLKNAFARKHSHALSYLSNKGVFLENLRLHSARMLTGATLGSALVLGSPIIPAVVPSQTAHIYPFIQQFTAFLKTFSQETLSSSDQKTIEENTKKFFGVGTKFILDGNRLPTYRGFMGLEQHLYRFERDTLDQHSAFHSEGIAPGRGAFGYFATNQNSSKDMEERERYYIVLQTFLIPNWNRDWVTLKKWYQFRKFLVINPQTGRAVVAVLGDSGPATWTGKQFGGSPEVMYGLGLYPKKTRGEVVVLFMDDPENEIPLGPLAPQL